MPILNEYYFVPINGAGHWHKCYTDDHTFFCTDMKCDRKFDTLCEHCEMRLKIINKD